MLGLSGGGTGPAPDEGSVANFPFVGGTVQRLGDRNGLPRLRPRLASDWTGPVIVGVARPVCDALGLLEAPTGRVVASGRDAVTREKKRGV